MIPTDLPPGIEVTTAVATRSHTDCVTVDPALVLWSEATGATVHVEGPFATPAAVAQGVPTTVRGLEAVTSDFGSGGYLAWTEPDGASWQLTRSGLDDATARAVAEALLLDSTPDPGQSVAVLPADAVPEGFGVLWQAVDLPKIVSEEDQRLWSVHTSVETCGLDVMDGVGDAPVTTVMEGLVRTTVRGRDAVGQSSDGSSMLIWHESPGVRVRLFCDVDLETLRDMAESLVPIEPDDARVDISTDVGPIDEEE